MTKPDDAVLPILQKIQEEVAAVRKDQRKHTERLVDLTDAVMETQDVLGEMRKDSLIHLGLTTKHRLDVDHLRDEMKKLKDRVAVLEARS
jgi:uncharacterized protein YpuA (DUF1002 family)